MLDYVITDTDGNRTRLNSVISVVINSDIDIPADDITLVMMYDARLAGTADMITAYIGERIVFTGQIDEIVNIMSQTSMLTKIKARSLAGKLLDNEAEPVIYNNPTEDYIYSRHLKPFGIVAENLDKSAVLGALTIYKGMSHWQALESFCRNKYGAMLRITGDGKVLFSGYKNNKPVVFGNSAGEIPYIRLKENIRRFELINEVKIKSKANERYNSRLINKNPDCKGISRIRYINVTNDRDTLETADRLIADSNEKAYSITLECLGCHAELPGQKAFIDDEKIDSEQCFVVNKIRYSADKNLESTEIILKKER